MSSSSVRLESPVQASTVITKDDAAEVLLLILQYASAVIIWNKADPRFTFVGRWMDLLLQSPCRHLSNFLSLSRGGRDVIPGVVVT